MKINKVNTTSQPKNNRNKVRAAAIAGSALGIATTVAGLYAVAKKGNPSTALKNLAYTEKDAFLIGTGSILGGLAGGLIADKDKENIKPKLREASQQFVGGMVFPLGTLTVANKILDKTGFKLPKIKSNSKPAQIANGVLAVLPKVVVTFASLFGGMAIGNKFMNAVNNKIYKEDVKHNISPEDYLVNADDLCLATSMVFKDVSAVSATTSKILPMTFLVAGAKSGMKQKEDC